MNIEKNLSGQDLTDRNFFQFDFSDSNLDDAQLSRACLREANLSRVAARNVSFVGADLRQAIFRNACLHYSEFCEADLEGADFTGADITGAYFFTARNIDKARFSLPKCFDWIGDAVEIEGEDDELVAYMVVTQDRKPVSFLGTSCRCWDGAHITVPDVCKDISNPCGQGIYLETLKACRERQERRAGSIIISCKFLKSEMVIPLGSSGVFRVPRMTVAGEVKCN